MVRKIVAAGALSLLSVPGLFADFSYQETTTVTGGAMLSMLKVVGVFSKQLREPMRNTVAIQGNRMAHRSQTHASIVDLDAQTITNIDLQKKSYSVVTFEEMKRMLDEMSQKMKKSDKAEVKWKVSASATGNTKQIAGYNAKEMLMKMEMEGTDKQSGQKGAMTVTTHVWLSPEVSGYRELRDFQKRMAEKLAWTPGGNMFMSNPDVAKGLAEASKEMSKLEGTPVYETVSMGAEGMAPAGEAQAPAQQQPQQQAERPSLGGALGGALGGRFGLGKRKQPKQEQPPQDTAAPAQASQSGSLIDMTMEFSNFSSAAADPSLFTIPAGFKKVEAPMTKGK